MTEKSELLACPLCGPGRVYLNPPSKEYRFGCINCPACRLTLPGEVRDPREMIEVWNTRALAQGASHTPAPVVHQINGPFASPVVQAEVVTTPCEQIPGAQHLYGTGEAGPVAWRFHWAGDEHDKPSDWECVTSESILPTNREGWVIQPLYAAPPSAVPFLCPKCGSRGETDGVATTVREDIQPSAVLPIAWEYETEMGDHGWVKVYGPVKPDTRDYRCRNARALVYTTAPSVLPDREAIAQAIYDVSVRWIEPGLGVKMVAFKDLGERDLRLHLDYADAIAALSRPQLEAEIIERCAKVAEEYGEHHERNIRSDDDLVLATISNTADDIATAIRRLKPEGK